MTGFPRDRRRRRRYAFAVLGVLWALLAPDGAEAQFVLYHVVHGDWTVTCARDMTTARVACTLTAPPPTLGLRRPTATIAVEDNAGGPVLRFHVLGSVDANRPVLALVDSQAPVAAEPNRFGEGGWQGAEARALIDAMGRGHRLSLVWTAAAEPAVRTADFALGGFAAGLDDYRRQRAAFGVAGSR